VIERAAVLQRPAIGARLALSIDIRRIAVVIGVAIIGVSRIAVVVAIG
jgi:hypothetical protein